MPLHILSELQSREARSVPFFAALPVLHGSGMTMLIVLFSIQSRKPAEYIKSDQMQRGRTSKEHFSTSEDAEREQLLSNASLRSGTIQHPPPVLAPKSALQKKNIGSSGSGGACGDFKSSLQLERSPLCSLNESIWTITFPYLNTRPDHVPQ